jgi:magnesium-transporting ATPase (P-type)
VVPRRPPATFWELSKEALEDVMLRVLIGAGVISLVVGFVEHPATGWIEGFAILLAGMCLSSLVWMAFIITFNIWLNLDLSFLCLTVVIVTVVTATNNMQKERQFRAIEDREKEMCVVVRNGQEMEIESTDVMLGDLIVLKQGDSIVADGVYITGTGT